MRRWLFLIFVFSPAACIPDYDDPFYIHGRVLAEDGTASASEGLVLHSADIPSVETASSDSGAFTFEVPYLAMTPFRPGAGWFRLVRAPDGYASEHAIHFVTAGAHDFRLPDWRPLRVALVNEGNAVFRVPNDEDAAARYVLELRSKSEIRWQWTVEPGAAVKMTAPIVEDAAEPRLVLRRLLEGELETPENLLGQGGVVGFVVEDASPSVDAATPGADSVSRLMPCDIDGVRSLPCPLTDGRMDELQNGALEIVLFFNASVRPRLALLRGMNGAENILVVEGRHLDSDEWRPLGRHDEQAESRRRRERIDGGLMSTLFHERFVEVKLEASVPITQLRLRAEPAGSPIFYSLRQLSVFE